MSWRYPVAIALVLLLGTTGSVAGQHSGHPSTGEADHECPMMALASLRNHSQQLGLTPDQVARVEALQAELNELADRIGRDLDDTLRPDQRERLRELHHGHPGSGGHAGSGSQGHAAGPGHGGEHHVPAQGTGGPGHHAGSDQDGRDGMCAMMHASNDGCPMMTRGAMTGSPAEGTPAVEGSHAHPR
jgi:hypothetical protein